MNNTHRYFLELAFNGSKYHGWQIQKNAVSVQEILNKALSTLLRQSIETVGCGRTDTGVHATQLYAHFDTSEEIDTREGRFNFRLNSMLPYDMTVKRSIKVAPDAHARFDAIRRAYQYHVHFCKDPFRHERSWLLRNRPDMELMNQAAQILLEYRDFSCFSRSNTQTFTNNCVINLAQWVEVENGMVFHISADRFLRNMVRAIVGTLMDVGKRKIKPEDIRQIIESKNRSNAGASVPACGLYLTEVIYPYPLEGF